MISIYLLIITWNVNRHLHLNFPNQNTGRDWLDKNHSQLHAAYKRSTSFLRRHRLILKVRKKIIHATGNQKKAWESNAYIEKNRRKAKCYNERQKHYHIMIKQWIQQEGIAFVNIYVPKRSTYIYKANIPRTKGGREVQ